MQLNEAKALWKDFRKKFVWTSDEDLYGMLEHWGYPVEGLDGKLYDDCDGSAHGFGKVLLEAGWPREDLSVAICRVETGEWHMVLLLREEKVYAADNRYAAIRRIDSLPYSEWSYPGWGEPITTRPWITFKVK